MTTGTRQGFIEKPAEINNLYSIYMLLDLPYKAGTLIQQAIDKGKLPADEKHRLKAALERFNALPAAERERLRKKAREVGAESGPLQVFDGLPIEAVGVVVAGEQRLTATLNAKGPVGAARSRR